MKKLPILILTILGFFLIIGGFQINAAAQQQNPEDSPRAATVTVSGKITTADGKTVRGAKITAIRNTGALTYSQTNAFGFYRIRPLESGETYVFQVTHKRYSFQPRVISLTEDVVMLDFVAQ